MSTEFDAARQRTPQEDVAVQRAEHLRACHCWVNGDDPETCPCRRSGDCGVPLSMFPRKR